MVKNSRYIRIDVSEYKKRKPLGFFFITKDNQKSVKEQFCPKLWEKGFLEKNNGGVLHRSKTAHQTYRAHKVLPKQK